MKKPLLTLLLCSAILYCTACCPQAANVTVTYSYPSSNDVKAGLFSHNVSYFRTDYQDADTGARNLWAWKLDDPQWEVKPQARGVIEDAATGSGATFGFPAGGWAATYHWRRGVGPLRAQVGQSWVRKRPDDDDPYSDEKSWDNDFGTDELIEFIKEVAPGAKPIISVNWWYWNKPGVPGGYPAKGAQEAANWVEYCNGVVTTDIIEDAEDDNWRPSKFVDPDDQYAEYEPSEYLLEDAEEWADSNYEENPTCWRSFESAPTGYFAWLRRYFAWQRAGSPEESGEPTWKDLTKFTEASYGAPYGVEYWQIDEEIPYRYSGYAPPSTTDAETYRDGVIAYHNAMAAKDSSVKIGAVMIDWANLRTWNSGTERWDPTANPGVDANWDQVVLDNTSKEEIDFIICHPFVGGNDNRYSRYGCGGDPETYGWNLQPVYLDAGTYTFRVRAKARPTTGGGSQKADYCRFSAYLIPCDGPEYSCNDWDSKVTLNVHQAEEDVEQDYNRVEPCDPPCDPTELWARHPWLGGASAQRYTKLSDTEQTKVEGTRSDYMFSKTIASEDEGWYSPWVKITNRPTGAEVYEKMMTYQKGSGTEKVMEFRTAEDQTKAYFAAPGILATRLAALKTYADSFSEGIEVVATQFNTTYNLTARPDQIRNMKSAFFAADLLKEMIEDGNVALANYWCLNSYLYHIAQPKGTWDPILGYYETGTLDNDKFLSSPQAQVYHLYTQHFGEKKLSTTVSDTGTFDSPLFNWSIAATTGNPYGSALASAMDTTAGSPYERIYVLVINKDWDNDHQWSVEINSLGAVSPTGVVWHTLKCWDATADALDAQNDWDMPNRVSIQSEAEPAPTISSGTVTLTHTFPASSITVLELGIEEPILSAGDLFGFSNGQSVKLGKKAVTGVFSDRFYIEEPDRTAGIAVMQSSSGRSVGDIVTVSGTLATSDGERVINSPSVTLESGSNTLSSVGMRNQWLGGAPSSTNTPTPKDGFGLYNVGLLVQSWGKVTATDAQSGYFYIDDGSNLSDGSGETGVRVILPSGATMPSVNDYRKVTGISGATTVSSQTVRVLKPRSASDISANCSFSSTTVDLWAGKSWVALPAIPNPSGPEDVFATCPEAPSFSPNGNLSRYDSPTEAWRTYFDCTPAVFGNCLLGDGFKMENFSEYTGMCYQGTAASGDQWISLPNDGFIAHPFTSDVSWSNCRFTDGLELKTPGEAVAAGWVSAIANYWDGATQQEKDVDIADSSSKLKAWLGYWVETHKQKLALIAPVP